jgi:menaquinone-specific isochorismate synthase
VDSPVPALNVVTAPIDDPGSLIGLLDRERQLLWQRRGHGMVGIGEAVRLEFTGASRFTDAARTWRRVAAAAAVSDPLAVPGTGLVAFATFAFSNRSRATSVLIVPSMIIGRRDGHSWVTRIDSDAPLPAPDQLDGSCRATLHPGSLTPDGYVRAVEAAIDGIRNNGLSKVVVARDLVGTLQPGADPRVAIAALAHGYPDTWTFAVDGFIGSSPETLVSVHSGTVSARVLAGSAARGTDAASDVAASVALATSQKDQDEHEFAVQSVMAALRPHSASVRSSEVPFTLKLPNLWHLASDVEGALDDRSSSLDLIGALHPTAAVAGTPTADAIAELERLEPFDRQRYAGPVGWVGADGDGEWAIALRCAQLDDDRLTAWAGAGIVAESVPGHELAETSMKFRPIVDAFS